MVSFTSFSVICLMYVGKYYETLKIQSGFDAESAV